MPGEIQARNHGGLGQTGGVTLGKSTFWRSLEACFPGVSVVKNSLASAGDTGDSGSISGSARFPWRRERQAVSVFLLKKCRG